MISKCLVLLGVAALAFSLPLDEKMDPTLHRGVDRATVLAPQANATYVRDATIRQPVGPSLVEGLNKSPGTPTVQDTQVRVGAMDKPVVAAYDATKEVAQDAAEKVKEGYEAGKQKVAEAADAAKEKVNEGRNAVADSMRSGADKVEARP